MKIHECQADVLFRQYGIPCPDGVEIQSVEEVSEAVRALNAEKYVIKAQIHSGGRGKGGGVKVARNPREVEEISRQIMGMRLVTKQTGPAGRIVRKLLICEGIDIDKEFYLAMTLDAQNECVTMIGSAAGGTEIEEIAASTPELICKQRIGFDIGLKPYQCMKMAKDLGITGPAVQEFTGIAMNMYRLFIDKDCSLVEINPLVMTPNGHLTASDAKINFDDNALYRQKEIAELRDPYEEDEREVEASKFDLNYVQLDGNIGCMVNGAGLAMATMDIIRAYGCAPANFLDVGGGATEEKVAGAFSILLSDPNVKGILVNIFGGIMKCDVIASGIVSAAAKLNVRVPLVVRLEGTNAAKGKEILENSELTIIPASDMADAAKKVCDIVMKGGQ